MKWLAGLVRYQKRLTTTEALFDRVEIGGVWWKKYQEDSLCLNKLANGIDAVNRAVIQDNDTAVLRVTVHFG
jgi:hypothetical protein